MHSPNTESFWVNTLLIIALLALTIVERSAIEKIQIIRRQTPLHFSSFPSFFQNAKRALWTGSRSWITVQEFCTWARESILTRDNVGMTISSEMYVSLDQSRNRSQLDYQKVTQVSKWRKTGFNLLGSTLKCVTFCKSIYTYIFFPIWIPRNVWATGWWRRKFTNFLVSLHDFAPL